MKKILLPTDFSANSWNAIQYAVQFFKMEECDFYLLHVTSSNETVNGFALVSNDFLLDKKNACEVDQHFSVLKKRIAKVSFNNNHRFYTIKDSTFFVNAIRKQVKEKYIDYIVMGTKGASGLKEVTVGSNTGEVITKVKCPILVIPEKAAYVAPKEIAFPTDYNISYPQKVLDTLKEVVSLHASALRVIHVVRKDNAITQLQQQNKTLLDEYLGDPIIHSFHALPNSNLEAAVQHFVESREIAMITMVAKNLNFFQRILFNPRIKRISYHTKIPFLVLHE